MSTRTYTATLAANAIASLPAGVFFYIKSAAAVLSVEARGQPGAPVLFQNVGAGLKFGPVPPERRWKYLDIKNGPTPQNVEVVISDDAEVDIASTVSVSGSVSTAELPASAVSTPAVVNVANAAASAIAANLARRRITIGAPSGNTGSLYVQATGAGANRGLELQPGTFIEVRSTAALDVRNDSGAAQNYTIFEES